MVLTNRSTSPSATWALLAATLASGPIGAADAQLRTVDWDMRGRSSEVEVGSRYGFSGGPYAGPWSKRLSRSMAAPFDPRLRSIAQVDHYSSFNDDQLICFIDTANHSKFHGTGAWSGIDLEFKVASLFGADTTGGYSSSKSVFEQACDLAGVDYRYDSMTECTIWGEQEYHVDSGEILFDGELEDPENPGNVVTFGRGAAWDYDWYDYYEERLGSSPSWNQFQDRKRLEAGWHSLAVRCGSYTDSVAPFRTPNEGGTSMWLKVDWYDVGPGSADSERDPLVARTCTTNADGAGTDVVTDDEDRSWIDSSSRSARVAASAKETIRAEDTGCWGRHEVDVDLLSGPRTTASTAESISEIDFTVYDDAKAHVVLEGAIELGTRFSTVISRIEILNPSGTVVWSDEIGSGLGHGSHTPTSSSSVSLSSGWYTIRVTTTATCPWHFAAGDAAGDCSFAVILNDRP